MKVSQQLNTCNVPKDALFLQENDIGFPLANMVAVEFWCQVPSNAGKNKLARNFPMPDGEMRRPLCSWTVFYSMKATLL